MPTNEKESLLPVITAILRSYYVRVVQDPTGTPLSTNITAEDLLKYGAFGSEVRAVTAAGNVTLANTDPIFVEIDPNGSDRDVTCPAAGNDNHGYFLHHKGSANTLTVKRSGGAVITRLVAGEIKYIKPSTANDFSVLAGENRFGPFASAVRTVTASGAVTLANSDPVFIEIDPNGSDRDVNFPVKGNDNHGYFVNHSGSANTLTLKRSGGATITTLLPGEIKYIKPSTANDFSAQSTTSVTPITPSGRLTLVTGTPVMTSSQAGKTTIYWTPYNGQIVPLYNGTSIVMTDVGGELSQATTDSTKSPAAVANNSNYDLFIWSDSGTIRCTRGPAWSSSTSRGTGAGTTELEMVKGIYVNKVAITNGPAAQRGTYVGTVRSNGSAQIDWIFGGAAGGGTAGVFGVWNMYNRVDVEMSVHDTTSSWTFSSSTAGPLNPGGTGSGLNNRISYVIGLAEDSLDVRMYCRGRTAAVNGAFHSHGIGIDSTTVLSATNIVLTLSAVAIEGTPSCYMAIQGHLGFHFVQMLQQGDGTNTSSMFGASNQNGLILKGKF